MPWHFFSARFQFSVRWLCVRVFRVWSTVAGYVEGCVRGEQKAVVAVWDATGISGGAGGLPQC